MTQKVPRFYPRAGGLYPDTHIHNSWRFTVLKLTRDPRLPGLSRQLAQAVGKPGLSTELHLELFLPCPFSLPSFCLNEL